MKIEIRTREIKDGNQTIYLDFYDNGRRWYEYLNLHLSPKTDRLSKAQNENAMKKAIEIKAKRMLGIEDEPDETDSNALPRRVFSDWMDKYLDGIKHNRSLSVSTYNNNRNLVSVIKAYLSYKHRPRMLMSKIDKKFMIGFFDYMENVYRNTKKQDEPKPLAPTTLHLYQRLLVAMLNVAVQEGTISANPFYAMERKQKFKKVTADRCFLEKEEVIKLTETACVNDTTKAAFLFCCYVGLRYSDVSTLTWGAIRQTDLGKVIALKAMKKTGKQVTVPLNKLAQEWLPERNGASANERIFKMTTLGQCDRVVHKWCETAGIEKNVTFHTSRHTFAVLSLTAGGDLFTVGKLMGHTDIKSTQVYADVVMDTKIDAVNRMSSFFSQG